MLVIRLVNFNRIIFNNELNNLILSILGGVIAIELCRLLEQEKIENFFVLNLILFESSHTFFNTGVHSNSKKFGITLANEDIFKRINIYTGTLSIYLSHMIGKPIKFELYEFLKNRCLDLDDALKKAFDYLKLKDIYSFDNQEEMNEMKTFLKILMLKSNAAFLYKFGETNKLNTPVHLIKSSKFMYNNLENLFIKQDCENNFVYKLETNKSNYDLPKISKHLKIFELEKGNHWSFILENSDKISEYLSEIFDSSRSKL